MPPKLFMRFFRWFCLPAIRDGIEGDLIEVYRERMKRFGKRNSDLRFVADVVLLFRPGIVRSFTGYKSVNNYDMFRNYFKVAGRNILKNKVYSGINIGGLAMGMVVTLLIGLWIYDELTMNYYHKNYASLVQVMQHSSVNGTVVTYSSLPIPTSAAIRTTYGQDFEHVAATWTGEQLLAYEDKVLMNTGCFAEPALPEMLTLEMIRGSRSVLDNPSSILICESLAMTLTGTTDPINTEIKLNGGTILTIKGVYKDLPASSSFNGIDFIAPVSQRLQSGAAMDNWYSSSFHIFAQLRPGIDPQQASAKIKNVLYEHTKDATKPVLFLNPMSRWHLYSFRDGNIVNGRMQFVWLFGIIGGFVLFLACINFMNLSTARSERRSKEVGIRKAIGSARNQLITQFLSESLLVVALSSAIALVLATILLPWFNDLSVKQMIIPWTQPALWLTLAAFIVIVSVIAGSYPAFYLSSFVPVRVLKGTFNPGRFSSLPRKVLVVIQFTVSVVMIIGTLIVYNQINFAKERPVGYNRENLITVPLLTTEINQLYNTIRQALIKSGAVRNLSLSSSPTTGIFSSADNLDWNGKDPDAQSLFGTICVEPDFGSVVGWQLKEGRDFSEEIASDSQKFIFNEAAIAQMGLKEPIGETIRWHGKSWSVIGVVRDMVMTSPFGSPMPTVFMMDNRQRPFNVMNIRLNETEDTREVLAKVEAVFKKYAPSTPFDYKFADQEYALKFAAEERVGKLASVFATLAIVISCLGLFGLASFMAERRTKEIGIRKVLGASVVNLWKMLSRDFVVLVLISCLIAVPIAWYLMDAWLQNYTYRSGMSWFVFLISCAGALGVTIATISYQALKASRMDPVKSLKSE